MGKTVKVLESIRQAPVQVTILGLLTFVGGILSVVSFLAGLLDHHFNLDIGGLIACWMGPGLISGKRAWRSWALFFALVGAALALVLAIIGTTLLNAPAPRRFGVLFESTALLGLIYSLWTIWVLQRHTDYFQH